MPCRGTRRTTFPALMLAIQIISDDKPGHLNQSKGLAEAMARLTPVHIEIIAPGKAPLWKRISQSQHASAKLPQADLFIAAGHKTHLPLLALGRNRKVPTVVLMKPSLPTSWFDLCLIPRHDLKSSAPNKNIIPTTGALNRLSGNGTKENLGLILIGGASRSHSWSPEPLRNAIESIVKESTLTWHLTDSRRTPADFLGSLSHLPFTLHPHAQTGTDWLPEMLGKASEAWVTEDSVSMIYEAITSRAAVGLLPMKSVGREGKMRDSLDQLLSDSYLTSYQQWTQTRKLTKPAQALAEADRCARLVLERLQLLPK
jgi:hypothetical protein